MKAMPKQADRAVKRLVLCVLAALAGLVALALYAHRADARDAGQWEHESPPCVTNACAIRCSWGWRINSQDLPKCPAIMKSVKSGSFANAVRGNQIVKINNLAVKLDFDAGSPVSALRLDVHPPAIFRTIDSVVVDPVKLKSGFVTRFHIGNEVINGDFPSVTNQDPATAVPMPGSTVRVIASLHHAAPNVSNRMRMSSPISGTSIINKSHVILIKDNGQWTNNNLKPWFDQLKSQKGLCCSFADGRTVADPDWGTEAVAGADKGQSDIRYWVVVDGQKIVVPPDAVVTEPNKFGQAVVWPYQDYEGKTRIRCFIAGAQG